MRLRGSAVRTLMMYGCLICVCNAVHNSSWQCSAPVATSLPCAQLWTAGLPHVLYNTDLPLYFKIKCYIPYWNHVLIFFFIYEQGCQVKPNQLQQLHMDCRRLSLSSRRTNSDCHMTGTGWKKKKKKKKNSGLLMMYEICKRSVRGCWDTRVNGGQSNCGSTPRSLVTNTRKTEIEQHAAPYSSDVPVTDMVYWLINCTSYSSNLMLYYSLCWPIL